MGVKRYNEGDYEGAFEYYTKAAELGSMMAHYNFDGKGVDLRGISKRKYTIWKRLPLVDIPGRGSILELKSIELERRTGQ